METMENPDEYKPLSPDASSFRAFSTGPTAEVISTAICGQDSRGGGDGDGFQCHHHLGHLPFNWLMPRFFPPPNLHQLHMLLEHNKQDGRAQKT
jgi:hypothetical protein